MAVYQPLKLVASLKDKYCKINYNKQSRSRDEDKKYDISKTKTVCGIKM